MNGDRNRLTQTQSKYRFVNNLARFENIDAEKTLPDAADKFRIAFLVKSSFEGTQDVVIAASRLATRGFRPVVLIEDPTANLPAWESFEGVPLISVAALDRNVLPWLGEIKLAVANSAEMDVWLGSLSRLQLLRHLRQRDDHGRNVPSQSTRYHHSQRA
jgi:hypothetical protein